MEGCVEGCTEGCAEGCHFGQHWQFLHIVISHASEDDISFTCTLSGYTRGEKVNNNNSCEPASGITSLFDSCNIQVYFLLMTIL